LEESKLFSVLIIRRIAQNHTVSMLNSVKIIGLLFIEYTFLFYNFNGLVYD